MKLYLFRYDDMNKEFKKEVVEVRETSKMYIAETDFNIFYKRKLLKSNENKLIKNGYFFYFSKKEIDFESFEIEIMSYYKRELYRTEQSYKSNKMRLNEKIENLLNITGEKKWQNFMKLQKDTKI